MIIETHRLEITKVAPLEQDADEIFADSLYAAHRDDSAARLETNALYLARH
ncbi:hypothetical protein ACFFTM_25135 [Pseudoduganella plicata]|uniref:hypothetical protein n=1 Tax=Pseudoduganella plicata TaxID=321984 RepID=UPI001E54ADC2|nr:hypothetical protein [Pseudoduganella plicata]